MESACQYAPDAVLIPGWGRSPGGGNGNPLQYSCLGGTWRAAWGRRGVRHDLRTRQQQQQLLPHHPTTTERGFTRQGGHGWGLLSRLVASSSFATPWTVARQDPLSVGFPRQEYWSGLPFPSPGDLPDPGIKSRIPTLQADSLLSEPPRKPMMLDTGHPRVFRMHAGHFKKKADTI